MAIGRYSHKIIFRTYTSVADGYGGTLDTPVDVLSTFAEKIPVRASRQLSEGQLTFPDMIRFRIRWRKNFEPTKKMRIVEGDKEYVINSEVQTDANRRFWEITAVAHQ